MFGDDLDVFWTILGMSVHLDEWNSICPDEQKLISWSHLGAILGSKVNNIISKPCLEVKQM